MNTCQRVVASSVLGLALAACGGSAAPLDEPAAPPAPAPTTDVPPFPADPVAKPTPASGNHDRDSVIAGERVSAITTAWRDGRPLYMSMCNTAKSASLEIWGEVYDPAFEIDEAIIAFSVVPRSASGRLACGDKDAGVKIVFAEERGAEFEVDPTKCSFELFDDGALTGIARGRVAAEYVGANAVRHSFSVVFTAPSCKP